MKPRWIFILVLLFSFYPVFTQEWSEPEMLPEPINYYLWWNHFPFVTYDGQFLYFASNRKNRATDDIYYCKKEGDSWGEPIRLNRHINTDNRIEHSPSLTADNKTLYFVRYIGAYSFLDYDIFYSTRQDTGWGPAVNIGPPVNSGWMEWICCISPGGDTLVFDAVRSGVVASPPDLYYSVKTDTGWSEPRMIFPDYASNAGRDNAPKISGDGKTIYFFKGLWVHEEMDIYSTTWNGERWTAPLNVGPPVNTPHRETTPALSPDGNPLYFSRVYLSGVGGGTKGIIRFHRFLSPIGSTG